MNISRRALLGSTAALGLAGCSTAGTPPANVTAAITALTGIIADVTAAISSGTLTAAQLADAQNQIAALNAQLLVLQASTTSTGLSSVLATVTSILGAIGTYLPVILPIIGMLTVRVAPTDTPLQALLRKHFQDLRTACGS